VYDEAYSSCPQKFPASTVARSDSSDRNESSQAMKPLSRSHADTAITRGASTIAAKDHKTVVKWPGEIVALPASASSVSPVPWRDSYQKRAVGCPSARSHVETT
jgi:hypothetical protein